MTPRVLFADSHKYFRSNMDRNYALKQDAVARSLGGNGLSMEDVSDAAPAIDVTGYDVLLVGVFAALRDLTDPPESGVPASWFRSIPRRCVIAEDTRLQDDLAAYLNANECQYLIGTYDCAELEQLLARCSSVKRTFVIPHHIDTGMYRRIDVPKKYDVLLYGSLDSRFYPFRRRISGILRSAPFAVNIVEYPGRSAFHPQSCGESLVRMINESWICVATPTISDYLVAKYFEISACGSLVAGKMATQGLPIWDGCYLPLSDDMSDSEIVESIGNALRDKEALLRCAMTAHDRIHRDYTLDRYVERLENVISEIATDDSHDDTCSRTYPSTHPIQL